MKFKEFITEGTKKDTIVVLNGRMNPVTRGHEENVNGMLSFANKHSADHLVIASHSQDNKKNPLKPEQKLRHLKRAFPGVNVKTSDKDNPTIFHQLSQLHDQGYKHVVLASGADRTEDYERIKQYNGKAGKHGYYNFNSITTASTGERKEGISGTDMRNHVLNDNFKEFKKNLPLSLANNHKYATDIFNDVKAGLAAKDKTPAAKPKPKKFAYAPVNEDYENPYRFDWGTPGGTDYMKDMTPGMKIECATPETVWSEKMGKCVPVREAYINNEIFRLDEIVESTNGDVGPIVFRGSTYVTMKLNDGTTVKHWLKDIRESTGKVVEKIAEKKNEPPVITYRKRFNEKRIPALLMTKEQLLEMNKANSQITYMGYKTQHLDMCPSAASLFKKLIGIPKLNPKYILQALQATDQYLGIEKDAVAKGFANEQIVHDFNMKFAIAHDTLNMLYVNDENLNFMKDHMKIISDLSMHRDGTFANEPISTVTVQGTSMEEGFDSADYKIVIDSAGRKRKVHTSKVMTGKKEVQEERKTITMKNNYSNLRKKMQELYEPDPPTHNRDINFSNEKDVFHGIDKPIGTEHVDGKPVGMVSFKSFMNDPMNKKISSEHEKDRQDVHRAQVKLGTNPSASYKQMKKAKQLEL
jgi:signal peptidase I